MGRELLRQREVLRIALLGGRGERDEDFAMFACLVERGDDDIDLKEEDSALIISPGNMVSQRLTERRYSIMGSICSALTNIKIVIIEK